MTKRQAAIVENRSTVGGWPRADQPSGKITLLLEEPSTLGSKKDLRDGLSAVARQGSHLWLANDETTSLERLTIDGDQARGHRSFDLAGILELPGDGEIDIEGLDVEGDALWLIGSHSSVRKRVKDKHSPDEAREALASVEASQRRQVLARVSTQALLDLSGNHIGGQQGAAMFGHGGGSSGGLLDMLSGDPHLKGFVRSLQIPGKDNGIDFEGLAATGGRVFIGLRGPVLRGWAVIIELQAGGPGINPKLIGTDGRRYRKHFLDLRGLGVRDLCRHGDDLLILAGPTMELDGRTAVFRWRDVLTLEHEAVLRNDDLKCELDIPFGKGEDGLRESRCCRAARLFWWSTTRPLMSAKPATTAFAPMSSICGSRRKVRRRPAPWAFCQPDAGSLEAAQLQTSARPSHSDTRVWERASQERRP